MQTESLVANKQTKMESTVMRYDKFGIRRVVTEDDLWSGHGTLYRLDSWKRKLASSSYVDPGTPRYSEVGAMTWGTMTVHRNAA
jgi:hypothetical protein